MDPANPYDRVHSDNDDSDDALHPTQPRQLPSQQDWARIRHVFEEEYINRGRRLKDVQRTLQQEHGFYATTKMYKTRIKSWRLRKYVKASEKEQIASFINDNDIKGDTLQKLKFNGRPARLDLVRRYCKKTGVHENIANALPTKALEQQLLRVGERSTGDSTTATPPATLLTPPGSSHRRGRSLSSAPADITPPRTSLSDPAESVAWHVQQYFEWHLAPQPSASMAIPSPVAFAPLAASSTVQSGQAAAKVATFFEKILLALESIPGQARNGGWLLVHQACSQAKVIIDEQHRAFLRLFIMTFTDERWSFLPGLRPALLRYLAKLSSVILGDEHDLSCILRLLKSEQVLDCAAEPALRIMVEILTKERGQMDNETCQAKRSLVDLLKRRHLFDEAIQIGNSMCVESNNLHGRNHALTRGAIRRLADTYVDQGRRDIARSGYQEVLNRSTTTDPTNFLSQPTVVIDEATIFSLHALCEIDRGRADFKARDIPFEQVLDTVLTELGTSKEDVMSCLATWCQPLVLRQRWLGSNLYSDRLLARWAISRS
ncbi:uncharacterized protein HMPREF1541_07323 [Cyphellophora europaea CBS 101466]|uniref:Clr5 domain-containing protein n=1 Tax=Cyphellophora europaea (strain CBS 101466) TaxID=1220924 RepID=W2RMZ2_CYPE1|nr:uncharacterized protein HMPREF1541_07323 [Cyphellophora europaea CBS 101466]ETN37700.1 hypothetical protein HMPREF1541_07323 [Cyphellophora europaea CBS 101466]